MPIHESDIEGLPFTGRFFGTRGRPDPAVNSAHIVRVQWPAVSVSHLHLVNAPYINAAVFALSDAHLNLEVKIFKLTVGAQVSVILVLAFLLDRLVDQQAVLNAPTID